MNAAEIALVASTALGLVACAGWVRAWRRELRAENACEELRASLMRGSALMRVKLRSAHHAADHELDIAVIDGTPHAFTDSVLPRARSVYERAVANKQIDPLP
jgi:hypothetical protein